MMKNFFSVFIFIFIFIIIFFIFTTYFSEKNIKKINLNRVNIFSKIDDMLPKLPFLKNDTLNAIVFNSGYEDNNNMIKRNFWNLFKK